MSVSRTRGGREGVISLRVVGQMSPAKDLFLFNASIQL